MRRRKGKSEGLGKLGGQERRRRKRDSIRRSKEEERTLSWIMRGARGVTWYRMLTGIHNHNLSVLMYPSVTQHASSSYLADHGSDMSNQHHMTRNIVSHLLWTNVNLQKKTHLRY